MENFKKFCMFVLFLRQNIDIKNNRGNRVFFTVILLKNYENCFKNYLTKFLRYIII